jgi:hypothetical protein
VKLELSRPIFDKSLKIELYEDLSSQSGAVPCGETGERTHVTLVFAFCNVANAFTNVLCVERRTWRLSLSACTVKYPSSLSHEFIGLCVDKVVIHCLEQENLHNLGCKNEARVIYRYCSCNTQASAVGGAACWWKKPSNRCRYSCACTVLLTVKLSCVSAQLLVQFKSTYEYKKFCIENRISNCQMIT